MNLNAQCESVWRSLKRAKPRSKRSTRLQSELVTIQVLRMRQEMMSGGPIDSFTKGWAVVVGKWGAAHYYTRDELSYAAALCGIWEVKVAGLRGAGDWKKCKRCEAKLKGKKS